MALPDGLLDGAGGRGTGGDVLGVDGGATKTAAAVLRVADRHAYGALAGPSNSDAVGPAAAQKAVEEAIAGALQAAELDGGQIEAAVLALAGTSTDRLRLELMREFGFRSVYLVNDVVGAWAAGTAGRPGIAVVSGTGSHVFGVNDRKETWKCGGWGHILGDEGSGYWLGLHAMKAALAARDGSGPPTSLLEAALEHYGLERIELLPDLVYGKPLMKSEIAALAARVADRAAAGDEIALQLFGHAARDLARQTAGVITWLGLGDVPFPVATAGSVFRTGPLLLEPFHRAISEIAPRADVRPPGLPAIAGPLVLALLSRGAWQADDEKWLSITLDSLHVSTPK
jgi:N-acetylglucosamine kinase-like BadF-type ATPase